MSDNTVPIRLIIADDHALVRGGFASLINMLNKNAEILESNSFDKTLSILSQESSIDMVLLDLNMPGMNGMSGIREICSKWPDVPVVVVTVNDDSKSVHDALRAGAMGYIPKSSTPNVTMSAIRLVLSGGIYLPPIALHMDIALHMELPKDSGTQTVIDRAKIQNTVLTSNEYKLTKRQIEILDLMTEGKQNKVIAENLGLTTGTIKMHISRIFKALNVKNRTEAVTKFSKLP